MRQWWNGLALRERRLVLVAALVLLLGVFYWGIWQPLDNRLQQAKAAVRGQQQQLEWVKQQADQVISLRAAGYSSPQQTEQPLTRVVTSTAGRFDIRPSRMQQQGDRLQVWIESVRFDNLLRWLEHLQQGYGVTVAVTDIAKEQAAGMVTVRRLELSNE